MRPLELESIDEDDVREPHRHAYHELIWVREGSGRHLIDGEPVEFGPRTLTLIAKGQVHQFERADRVGGVVVRFDDEWLAGSRRWLFSGGSCSDAERAGGRTRPASTPCSTSCARRWSSPPGPSPQSCGATFCRRRSSGLSAGARLSSRAAARRARTSSSSSGSWRRSSAISRRHHEAAHYAAELGVTTGTLSRTLMRLSGRTTKQLILDRVLLEAARLLRFSDLSIKEIAARLGFTDQFAFSKAFKRQRGEAPLDFRNRL